MSPYAKIEPACRLCTQQNEAHKGLASPSSRNLEEPERTAADNAGVPLGSARFFQETGVSTTDWEGKFWARWGDALTEAGFQPNQFTPAYDKAFLIEKFASFIREIGKFPVKAELRIKTL